MRTRKNNSEFKREIFTNAIQGKWFYQRLIYKLQVESQEEEAMFGLDLLQLEVPEFLK